MAFRAMCMYVPPLGSLLRPPMPPAQPSTQARSQLAGPAGFHLHLQIEGSAHALDTLKPWACPYLVLLLVMSPMRLDKPLLPKVDCFNLFLLPGCGKYLYPLQPCWIDPLPGLTYTDADVSMVL